MPYAYWGGECSSERAPALGETAFWCRVLDCGRERELSRSIDTISKSLSKWSPRKGKSCHLTREEWFFYPTRQCFKEIVILWRNSSILNDEAITIRVSVRLQRKSEQQRLIQLTNIHGYLHRDVQSSGFIFWVSSLCFTVIPERFSYHLHRKFRLPGDFSW